MARLHVDEKVAVRQWLDKEAKQCRKESLDRDLTISLLRSAASDEFLFDEDNNQFMSDLDSFICDYFDEKGL